jgi:putative transposase
MARRPRFPLIDFPFHVVQRGNDRHTCFFGERDYAVYLKALAEACRHYGLVVHAYVLMTNHVHLLVTPRAVDSISRTMQSVGARYVRYVNKSSSRTGTLWEGRYRACLIECDEHVLAACRYIDLNPVRAGLVARPADYRWSSYLALVGARWDPLVAPHAVLDALGRPRDEAYASWCRQGDRDEDVSELRRATNEELAFGTRQFKARVERQTGRATSRKPTGFAARR